MRALGSIGVLCLAAGCCFAQAQPQLVDDSYSSSNPHPTMLQVSLVQPSTPGDATLLSPTPDVIGLGNAWIYPDEFGGFYSPAGETSDATLLACAVPLEANLVEAPGGGLTRRDFNMKGAFTRDHVVKMAQNFVPGQPLPDAPSYVPMTSREKFDHWMHHTYSADMFMGTMFDSLILQATGAYPDFGGGMGGFSKRYTTSLISAEASSLFGRWLFPTILHQDPRYFPSTQRNVLDRMAYAASRTLITRSDDGRNVVNSSLLLTLLFSSALANGYKPNYDESFQATLANAAAGLGAVAQTNLMNEFWPDIKLFFSRHEPDSAKYVQKKIDTVQTKITDMAPGQKKNQQ